MPRYTHQNAIHQRAVRKVFLDGELINGVTECDTDEGWIEHHTGRIAGSGIDAHYEKKRLTGVVTIEVDPELKELLDDSF